MKLLIFLNILFCLNEKPDSGEKVKLHLLIPKPGVKMEMIDQFVKKNDNLTRIIELNIEKGFKLNKSQPIPDFILFARALDIKKIRKRIPFDLGHAGYFEVGNHTVLVYPKQYIASFFELSELTKTFDIKLLESYEIKDHAPQGKYTTYYCTYKSNIFSKTDSLIPMPQ